MNKYAYQLHTSTQKHRFSGGLAYIYIFILIYRYIRYINICSSLLHGLGVGTKTTPNALHPQALHRRSLAGDKLGGCQGFASRGPPRRGHGGSDEHELGQEPCCLGHDHPNISRCLATHSNWNRENESSLTALDPNIKVQNTLLSS